LYDAVTSARLFWRATMNVRHRQAADEVRVGAEIAMFSTVPDSEALGLAAPVAHVRDARQW